MKKYIRYAILVIIAIIILALCLAYLRGGTDACSVSLKACFTKNRLSHGAIGRFFANIDCIWSNMVCVIKSLF